MAISLVLEDGTIVDGANTWAELDTAIAYAESCVGSAAVAWLALEEEKQKASLVQSCRMLGTRLTWNGRKVDAAQTTVWPRVGCVDADGYAVDEDVVPLVVIDAQCETAIRLTVEDYSSDVSGSSGAITKEKVGPIEVEYSDPTSTETRGPLPDFVLDMLAPFARTSSSGPFRLSRG